MGAKAWFVAYFDDDLKKILKTGPKFDRATSLALAERRLLGMKFRQKLDGCLGFLNSDPLDKFVGDYGGLKITAHDDLALDFPSRIHPRWCHPDLGLTACFHTTHSAFDWFACSIWREGGLIRSPDSGVMEDIGKSQPFERPCWDESFAVEMDEGEEPYPLAFHPLEMMEASLLAN